METQILSLKNREDIDEEEEDYRTMIERCLGPHRCRRIQRALRHLKVTVLCLVLTVVVLRGTIGAGKFGTPEQDLDEIHQHFQPSRKRAEPHRVLEEIQTGGDSSSSTSGDGNSAGKEDKPDPNKPYTLGPKISDWDEQRSDWLAKNPTFPNFIGPNKPRVLLVTGSAPKPCENPVGDHYLLKSIKNKIDYCRLHGIEIFYNMALLDAEMAGFWAKLPLIRKLLLSHPEVEFLWWMDSDAMFTDMAFELPWERYKEYNLVMHGWNEMVYDEKNWIGLNTGSFLFRNNQWALDLLDTWAPMGPKGKIREEAGKVLTRELKGRPVFEADDQSAMVYLLATQRDTWGNKVYLESGYYLHGYWGILVDRYEEMIENYHPGLGDHRWPLVTHFVGCKPCGKFGDYPVERCLKQMDRAFNFGDNQILQIYGFTHKSLASRKVKRVRNETSNPLEMKDELGLLHPAFKAVKLQTNQV
ncbi:BnaCnng19100D [Brassica napus]|uniref:xyloglucan 6-xylosyltransferase n=1 Tax=Brassica napus TaxID=3708 RepID=A0A078IMX6_BRANA|nr:BnaCnng19100D [Brassica napus]